MKILLVEDNPGDARLFNEMLIEERGFQRGDIVHVTKLSDALTRLSLAQYEIIVLDLGLPDSQGLDTLQAIIAHQPEEPIPIVVLTGHSDDRLGLESVKSGAQDYLVKNDLSPNLLAKTLFYAIERNHLLVKLKKAKNSIKVLQGLLPICASCKQIRDDRGYWNQIECYIRDHSEAEFSHGICPDCIKKLYPDIADYLLNSANARQPIIDIAQPLHFEKNINKEWGRAMRDKRPLALLFVIVEPLLTQHENIERVEAAVIKVIKRAADYVVSYGEGNFVIILPSTDFAGAWNVANSMLENLDLILSTMPSPAGGKVSIGGAVKAPREREESTILISAAKQALSEVKDFGSERIKIRPLAD